MEVPFHGRSLTRIAPIRAVGVRRAGCLCRDYAHGSCEDRQYGVVSDVEISMRASAWALMGR
jgi:hypothetical protein